MQKIKKFFRNHSNIDLSWGTNMWYIIPNVALIYHEYSKGISFSFEWLKIYFWIEFNIKPYIKIN